MLIEMGTAERTIDVSTLQAEVDAILQTSQGYLPPCSLLMGEEWKRSPLWVSGPARSVLGYPSFHPRPDG